MSTPPPPATPEPARSDPATPDPIAPATPEPATPAPGTPDPAAPELAAPRPSGPEPLASEPLASEPVTPDPAAGESSAGSEPAAVRPAAGVAARLRGLSPAGVAIAVLLALLGFGLVAQFRSVATDSSLDTAREDDLVRILSDLEAREQRLSTDIRRLEDSERQLGSGAQRREAAIADAARRADALGILAGTLPAEGPGMRVRLVGNADQVHARTLLDTVQELRNSGAEVMQLTGGGADPMRIVASSYFVAAEGGVRVDGKVLAGPYTIDVIGDATIMRSALTIPGGVVETVTDDGGSVTMEPTAVVKVTARYTGFNLQYARPAS